MTTTAAAGAWDKVPRDLVEREQWVLWRFEKRDGKSTKVPYQVSGARAKVTAPATWTTAEKALASISRYHGVVQYDGVGFVLTPNDPFAGVDLDHCRNRDTGDVAPWARAIVDALNSYTEITPSGEGLRVFVRGVLPPGGRKRGDVEMYDRARYLTVTGAHLPDTPTTIEDRTVELAAVHARYLGAAAGVADEIPPAADADAGDLDDAALVERARSATNGAAFARLWSGDASGHASRSEADLALCSHLAFWTGRDAGRIDRLFRQSGLMRAKWDERRGDSTYGAKTIARAIAAGVQTGMPGGTQTQAEILMEIAEAADLFHDGDRGFATVSINGHHETWAIRSRDFKLWLTRRFYEAEGRPPSAQAMSDALGLIEARGRFDGKQRSVAVRVAHAEGAIYIDLGNEERTTIKITGARWEVAAEAPVRFRRTRGMLALPVPEPGGSIDTLWRFVNIKPEDRPLFAGALVMALNPTGPYPTLVLHGGHGCAKSSSERVFQKLVDPNTGDLRSEPRELRDLAIAASNSWCVAFDNLSSIAPWFSDALCRLSTGAGFATRELYTDLDEIIVQAQRPIILNGIEEIVTRPDLLSRSVILYLPEIDDDHRRDEREFWADFDASRPALLGAVLDAVSAAMRNLPGVKLPRLPRMADFARWAVAAEPALGLEPNAFITAYTGNRAEAHELALEASPIAPAIQALSESGWEGTAKELQAAIETHADEAARKGREWPKSPKAISNALRRIVSNLRAIDVVVEFHAKPELGARRRQISIRREQSKGKHRSDSSDGSGVPIPTVPATVPTVPANDENPRQNARNDGNGLSPDFSGQPDMPDEVLL